MKPELTGLTIANTHNPIACHRYLGGPGHIFLKALAAPAQLSLPWQTITFVRIPPGANGIGAHRQAAEEILLVLSGQGNLLTNGEASRVEAGMLIGAPVGTVHALTNHSLCDDLTLLVVEVTAPAKAPVYPPSWCHLVQEMALGDTFHPVVQRHHRVRPRLASVNLRHAFAASWGSLTLVELAPGCRIPRYTEPEHDHLLFVLRGHATFTFAGEGAAEAEALRVHSDNRSHQSVLVPRGVRCGWINRASGETPLLVACLTVRPAPPPERGAPEASRKASDMLPP
jgi:quercetin dioxygenase-like cupin family protein